MFVKCPSCNAEHDCGPGTVRCGCGAEIQVDPNGQATAVDPSARKKKRRRGCIKKTFLYMVILPLFLFLLLLTFSYKFRKMLDRIVGHEFFYQPPRHVTDPEDICIENGEDDNDHIDIGREISSADDNDDIIPNAQE